MVEYKNPKAIALLKEAQELEDYVASKEPELERNNLPFPTYYLDLLTQAAGLRIQADEIEFGGALSDELEDA